jgi:hypothetical protein
MSNTPGFAVPPELRAKFPNLESFWPYLEGLNSESHRGQVLITAGFLEERLKKILLAFMLDVPEAMKLLEGGNAKPSPTRGEGGSRGSAASPTVTVKR